MSNPKDDITTSIEVSEDDVADLKKVHYKENAGQTRIKAPVADVAPGLNPELLNMLKLGKRFASFQGLDRCIRVLEPGTPNQRHCGAMMVKNLTANMQMCSNCDRIKDVNAKPTVINSSMIRLSPKELEECGLTTDPLAAARIVPPQPKKGKKSAQNEAAQQPRRVKVKPANKVTIEMSMEELKNNPDVVKVMLNKTLEAIFELPVSNFREAEAIRVVKERVESFLKGE